MKLLDRHSAENARSYALRTLLYNIINLELIPGRGISENELSTALGLSRTPVREALIELSKIGLVEILPQRGSYISKIDYNLIEESRFMRLVLENAVLKLACEGIDEGYLAQLSENVALQKQYFQTENHLKLFELDDLFHKLIFKSVGKDQIYEVIHSQMVHFDRLRALSIRTIKHLKTVEDHENIFYALSRKDSELAEHLMTRHLTRHQVEKTEILALYPDYFTEEKPKEVEV